MRIVRSKGRFVAVIVLIGVILSVYLAERIGSKKPALSGSYNVETVVSGSISRRFSYYRPDDLSVGAALIFILHGSTGDGATIRAVTGYEFDLLADQHKFIVAYPNGYKNHWNDCRGQADYAANVEGIDDVTFFADMVDFFVKEEGIDPGKVYVAGHSNGGQMVYRLALEAGDRYRAVAVVSASLPDTNNLNCEETFKPVSVAIFNGTEDALNPYDGGLVMVGGNVTRGNVRSSFDTARYWVNLAGGSTGASTIAHPEVDGFVETMTSEARWTGEKGVEIRLYTLRGSGHSVPRKGLLGAGRGGGRSDISAPTEIIDFFLSR